MSRQNRQRKQITAGAGTLLVILAVIALVLLEHFTGLDLLTFPAATEPAERPAAVEAPPAGDWWEVHFTAPVPGTDLATASGGVDEALATAIGSAVSTVDIAAFEFNLPRVTQALIEAHGRGVRVRVVTDDEHGIEDEDSTLPELIEAGIPVVDDGRSAYMHDKFVIIDGHEVWSGSWNLTINGTYRNDNNALVIRVPGVVANYQAEFEEMFSQGEFGPSSPANTPNPIVELDDGTVIETYFSPEDDPVDVIIETIGDAESQIRFMAFAFTHDGIGQAVLERLDAGVDVAGIFETRGSNTRYSELGTLSCAGADVRLDGNPYTFHHKVFVIDGQIVITGSLNFSANAAESNDENVLIIHNPDLASAYLAEFERAWQMASPPEGITCP